MSNHVHFVLYGEWKDVKAFIDGLKSRYSKYLHNKYGTFEFLRRNGVRIEEVSSLNEGLEKAVAYTQMNCVAANICLQPTQYQWGTGPLFFSASKRSGTRLGDLSKRARIRLFHCCDVDLPSEWLVGKEGYILPESYVCWSKVEALYRTPNRMSFFLRNSSKARRILEERKAMLPSFKDQSLVLFAKDICLSLFRKSEIIELEEAELQRLVYELSRRSGSDVGQLARVLGLRPRDVSAMLSKE